MATATKLGSPAIDTSQSHRAARPAPPCANARSPTTLPAPSSRQAWCFAEPQSMPANQRIVSSAIVSSAMVLSSRIPRALTTPAGTCMGARGRDVLLGIRRGQPAGAQIHVGCSWHECTDGCSRQAGSHGQLTQALIGPSRIPVHGHTPLRTGQPDQRPFRTNLDTGAVLGGALTAGVFTNDQPHAVEFLQACEARPSDRDRLRSGRRGETLNSRQLSLSGENSGKVKSR